MLAGRLIRVAKDILGEYSRFQLNEQLQAASALSARRANVQDQAYLEQAHQLREWAQSVINQTKIEKYPSDLLKFLKESKYAPALPERLARIVLNGFPNEKNAAISSPELGIYIQEANALQGELRALVTAGQRLNLEEVTIPQDEIGFDLILPRSVFHNQADEFDKTLSRFVRLMSSLIELTTGSKSSPTLTYTSASVITVGLALKAGAAWTFLKVYKEFLEVVEKHLSIIKTIKELLASPLKDKGSDLERQMPEVLEGLIRDAVEKVIASSTTKLPEERVNEIKVALIKDGRVCVQAIANGAKIGITVESLDKISPMTEVAPEVTLEQINEIIEQQKKLERRIDDLVVLLEGSPLLLPVTTGKDD
jgi:hypothetical protein